MKKLISVFTLFALICVFPFLDCFHTGAAAAEEQTVYATTDVNVRTGPGTKHAIIDVLTKGGSVVLTESGSNGWSKVVFNGSEGYIRSKYLSSGKGKASQTADDYDESSDGYQTVDQTVYANVEVNVRTGPGMEYDAIGQCEVGKDLHRTGIGENGWSRVIYKGDTAYVRSKYLSDTKREAKEKGGSGLKLEEYGRLSIPDLDIDVGLYYCSSDAQFSSLQQSIVDAEDSAAYLDQAFTKGVIIADHNHQGFSALRSCEAKRTRAYIDYGTHTKEYVCTAVGEGTNTGRDLLDWKNNSLNYGTIPGGLAMYTCNENWNDVTITYWKAD